MQTKFKAWLFLLMAIVLEVLATLSLKVASREIWGYLTMGICIVFSYYFMGLSVRSIAIGIAYAVWEVLGLLLIVGFGVFFFGEVLNIYQKIGIIAGILGIILINLGEKK